ASRGSTRPAVDHRSASVAYGESYRGSARWSRSGCRRGRTGKRRTPWRARAYAIDASTYRGLARTPWRFRKTQNPFGFAGHHGGFSSSIGEAGGTWSCDDAGGDGGGGGRTAGAGALLWGSTGALG